MSVIQEFSFKPKLETLILFSDISVDTDDLMALLYIIKMRWYNILIVCGGKDPIMKARYAKGVINKIMTNKQYRHIQVLAGSDCNIILPHQFFNLPFELEEEEKIEADWFEKIEKYLTLSERKFHCLVIGPMTDFKELLTKLPELCQIKFGKICLMSDVKEKDSVIDMSKGYPTFASANNATFDSESSEEAYRLLYKNNYFSQTIIVSSFATAKAKVGFDFYQNLLYRSDNSIARIFLDKQEASLFHLWQRCIAPRGSILRGSLPDNRNAEWFNNVFCSGLIDLNESNNPNFNPVAYLISIGKENVLKFQLYDAIAAHALLANDKEYQEYYKPVILGKLHIIGLNPENYGIIRPQKVLKSIKEIVIDTLSYYQRSY